METDDIGVDRPASQVCHRLGSGRRKLIEDLEAGYPCDRDTRIETALAHPEQSGTWS
jgi:hypothetical protein